MAFHFKVLKEITRHPLTVSHPWGALERYARFHISQLVFPHAIVYPWVNGLQLLIRRGQAGLVGNIYTGLYDFEEMFFVLHLLRPNDFCVDAGANAGVYSLLAASVGAEVLAIEPIPASADLLHSQIRLNELENHIQVARTGLGETPGSLYFTTGQGTMNHVVSAAETTTAQLEVPITPLDTLCTRTPCLIKIDTEGFELPSLKGASRLLSDPTLLGIIVELNGSGQRYGWSDGELDAFLRQQGFAPCRYLPRTRRLESLASWRSDQYNTLYLRDLPAIQTRLNSAKPQTALGQSF
ncbi:MAG: FkbM family methyltransferase [Candidatus Sericytochromatia bacterium]